MNCSKHYQLHNKDPISSNSNTNSNSNSTSNSNSANNSISNNSKGKDRKNHSNNNNNNNNNVEQEDEDKEECENTFAEYCPTTLRQIPLEQLECIIGSTSFSNEGDDGDDLTMHDDDNDNDNDDADADADDDADDDADANGNDQKDNGIHDSANNCLDMLKTMKNSDNDISCSWSTCSSLTNDTHRSTLTLDMIHEIMFVRAKTTSTKVTITRTKTKTNSTGAISLLSSPSVSMQAVEAAVANNNISNNTPTSTNNNNNNNTNNTNNTNNNNNNDFLPFKRYDSSIHTTAPRLPQRKGSFGSEEDDIIDYDGTSRRVSDNTILTT